MAAAVLSRTLSRGHLDATMSGISGALAAVEAAQTQIVEQKRAAQIRNDLIAVVSHEMRTPLTSIHGSLNLLQSGVGGQLNDSGRRLHEVACRNSQRLVRLVKDHHPLAD